MGLLSIFQRSGSAPAGSAEAGDPVQAARVRARRRLIGAAVLVVAGVIGFPIVFETQPRPIPVDIPIEIPRRDSAAPLAMPAPRPAAVAKSASAAVPAPREEIVTETRAEAGKPVPAPAASPASTPAPAPAPAPPKVAESPRAPAPAAPSAAATEAARAKALLEGKDAAAKPVAKSDAGKEPVKDAGRFVVQVGAFADAAAARETRSKVEKLGFKTYTQVVDTASGSRTRVRVGPFASRDEADKALAKARGAGINAVVLTL